MAGSGFFAISRPAGQILTLYPVADSSCHTMTGICTGKKRCIFPSYVDVQHRADEYTDNKGYCGNPQTDEEHLPKASLEGKILGHGYIEREQEYDHHSTQQGEHECVIRAGKDQEWQDRKSVV